MVSTPEAGEAATASCPSSPSMVTTWDPMSPVPPMTTIFMMDLRGRVGCWLRTNPRPGAGCRAPVRTPVRSLVPGPGNPGTGLEPPLRHCQGEGMAIPGGASPLLGRGRECAVLDGLVENVRAGRSAVLVL